MKRTLESVGYLVLEADSGETAANVCSKHQGRIDLLIADLIMPRIDGFVASARLLRARPEMKLLFVSGYAEISPSVRENLGESRTRHSWQNPIPPLSCSRKCWKSWRIHMARNEIAACAYLGAAGVDPKMRM